VWSEAATRLAGTENVRAALALVARGEARLGIVYGSDAVSEPRVRVVDIFPASSHPPIEYPAAITAISTNPDAPAFLAYLRSPDSRRIFEANGFVVMP
jgi:molybdate transport system substrate-binding protein